MIERHTITTPRSFIERAMHIMNVAWHISHNGGPQISVRTNPVCQLLNVHVADHSRIFFCYADQSELGDSLDECEAYLQSQMERLQ